MLLVYPVDVPSTVARADYSPDKRQHLLVFMIETYITLEMLPGLNPVLERLQRSHSPPHQTLTSAVLRGSKQVWEASDKRRYRRGRPGQHNQAHPVNVRGKVSGEEGNGVGYKCCRLRERQWSRLR